MKPLAQGTVGSITGAPFHGDKNVLADFKIKPDGSIVIGPSDVEQTIDHEYLTELFIASARAYNTAYSVGALTEASRTLVPPV